MQRAGVWLVIAWLVIAPACSKPCDPMTEACTLEKDVSTIEVVAGREDEDTCQSWSLNNRAARDRRWTARW
ncbi:MAG: hypothetical protein H0T79_09315 [Deltaproteobacteria bacterium]|nr:hypothetical protein [Deltaproteobacteria bacterium]